MSVNVDFYYMAAMDKQILIQDYLNYQPRKKKLPSKSKAKGSAFEREVANFLTELYGETFIRAPGSGAYVGGSNAVRKEVLHEGTIRVFKGDICPGESFGRLVIECKNYKDFPFHQFFTQEIKMLNTWIEQLLDSIDEGDVPLLIFKISHRGKYIAYPGDLKVAPTLGMTYSSKDHGNWFVTGYDEFWRLNSGTIKALSAI